MTHSLPSRPAFLHSYLGQHSIIDPCVYISLSPPTTVVQADDPWFGPILKSFVHHCLACDSLHSEPAGGSMAARSVSSIFWVVSVQPCSSQNSGHFLKAHLTQRTDSFLLPGCNWFELWWQEPGGQLIWTEPLRKGSGGPGLPTTAQEAPFC